MTKRTKQKKRNKSSKFCKKNSMKLKTIFKPHPTPSLTSPCSKKCGYWRTALTNWWLRTMRLRVSNKPTQLFLRGSKRSEVNMNSNFSPLKILSEVSHMTCRTWSRWVRRLRKLKIKLRKILIISNPTKLQKNELHKLTKNHQFRKKLLKKMSTWSQLYERLRKRQVWATLRKFCKRWRGITKQFSNWQRCKNLYK